MATRERMPCLCTVRTEHGWAMAPCGTKNRCTKNADDTTRSRSTRSINECFRCVDDDSQLAECLQSGADTPWSEKRRKSSIRRISFCAILSLGGGDEPDTNHAIDKERPDERTDGMVRCGGKNVHHVRMCPTTAIETETETHTRNWVGRNMEKGQHAGVPSYFELGGEEETNGTQGMPLGTPLGFQYHISDSQFKTPPVPIEKQSKCKDVPRRNQSTGNERHQVHTLTMVCLNERFQVGSHRHSCRRLQGIPMHACTAQCILCQKQEIWHQRWTVSHAVHIFPTYLKCLENRAPLHSSSRNKHLLQVLQPNKPYDANKVNLLHSTRQ